MNIDEKTTRKGIIDQRLFRSGWNVNNSTQVTSELDIWVGLPVGIKEIYTLGLSLYR